MGLDKSSVQARRDHALRAELDADDGVQAALERLASLRSGRGYGYRRKLLSSALRLTRSMSPEIADIVTECRALLDEERLEIPIEIIYQAMRWATHPLD